jgi:hypothetical protein
MEFTTITRRVAAHYQVEDLDATAAPTVANVRRRSPHCRRWKANPAETEALRAPINHDAMSR